MALNWNGSTLSKPSTYIAYRDLDIDILWQLDSKLYIIIIQMVPIFCHYYHGQEIPWSFSLIAKIYIIKEKLRINMFWVSWSHDFILKHIHETSLQNLEDHMVARRFSLCQNSTLGRIICYFVKKVGMPRWENNKCFFVVACC